MSVTATHIMSESTSSSPTTDHHILSYVVIKTYSMFWPVQNIDKKPDFPMQTSRFQSVPKKCITRLTFILTFFEFYFPPLTTLRKHTHDSFPGNLDENEDMCLEMKVASCRKLLLLTRKKPARKKDVYSTFSMRFLFPLPAPSLHKLAVHLFCNSFLFFLPFAALLLPIVRHVDS